MDRLLRPLIWGMVLLAAPVAWGPVPAAAQAAEAVGLSLAAYPLAELAFGSQVDFSSLTVGGGLGVEYRFPFFRYLGVGAAGSYRYLPVTGQVGVNVLSAGGQLLGYLELSPRLVGSLSVGAGYYYGALSGAPSPGSRDSFQLSGALGLRWLFTPGWAGFLGLQYDECWSLYRSVGLHAGVRYAPVRGKAASPSRETVPEAVQQTLPQMEARGEEGALLELSQVSPASVYPVLAASYEARPLGTAILRNPTGETLRRLSLDFTLEGYADAAHSTGLADELGPRQTLDLSFHVPLGAELMIMDGPVEARAKAVVGYEVDGKRREDSWSWTVRIESRNAVPPGDIRAVSAFVTAEDPVIRELARGVVDRLSPREAVDGSLQAAIALHEALALYGISEESGEADGAAGMLQFPRDTLEAGSGSGDDLAVLYAALLEAAGVETALFVLGDRLVPGFSLAREAATGGEGASGADLAVPQDGKAWIPVWMGAGVGFAQAARAAATAWADQEAGGTGGFIRLRQAWRRYPPAVPGGAQPALGPLSTEELTAAVDREIEQLVADQLSARVAELRDREAGQGNERLLANRIGVLYARYGLYERARRQFEQAGAAGDYLPALVNLGHLEYLQGRMETALDYYERARSLDPDDQLVVLSLARVNYELDDYDTARSLYARLRQINALLASTFAYLTREPDSGRRAPARDRNRRQILWADG